MSAERVRTGRAEAWTDVRKAVWTRGWLRWEELTALERLVVRYETPAGFEHDAYEWCRDPARDEWLVRLLTGSVDESDLDG